MALILNIDTATESAIISISEKDKVLAFISNPNQKDHASFLQPSIKELLQKADLSIKKLNAISVTAGPGSYTGIRVGMASAKGLCYALKIPLITINTLDVIALSSIQQIQDKSALYCAIIDARRMEVFTAVYDHHLTEIIKPCALVIDEGFFKALLEANRIYFSGSGILKLRNILKNKNAVFIDNGITTIAMSALSYDKYVNNCFADIFYAEPMYLKGFYSESNSL